MNAVERAIQQEFESASDKARDAAALMPFVNVPGVQCAWVGMDWENCASGRRLVHLTVEEGVKPRATVTAAMRAVGAQCADKQFDEKTGEVKYVIKGAGVNVVIVAGAPETCEVEEVEEEVKIPAVEARTEVRRVYRLKDPKCLERRSTHLVAVQAEPKAAL